MNRRNFLKLTAAGAVSLALQACGQSIQHFILSPTSAAGHFSANRQPHEYDCAAHCQPHQWDHARAATRARQQFQLLLIQRLQSDHGIIRQHRNQERYRF